MTVGTVHVAEAKQKTSTEGGSAPGDTTTGDETSSGNGQPGFGVLVSLLAVAGLVLLRRR
ncbi:hypothetical protein BG842_11160 [Haladaptatus sp. W1]|nr:hypothetical protein BG842_11160 [Haladaptatus sp. W1]